MGDYIGDYHVEYQGGEYSSHVFLWLPSLLSCGAVVLCENKRTLHPKNARYLYERGIDPYSCRILCARDCISYSLIP